MKILLSTVLLLSPVAAYSHSEPKETVAPLPASERNINRCGLHHVTLQAGTVPILYGLIHRDDDYEEAARKGFPRAQSHTFGGCVKLMRSTRFPDGRLSRPYFLESQTIKFCPQCRAAEKGWLKSHNYGSNWSKPHPNSTVTTFPSQTPES